MCEREMVPARPIEEGDRACVVIGLPKPQIRSTTLWDSGRVHILTIHVAPTIARLEYTLSAVATQIRGMATKPIGNTKYSRWKTTTRTAVSRFAINKTSLFVIRVGENRFLSHATFSSLLLSCAQLRRGGA